MRIELNVVELYNILTDDEKEEMLNLLLLGSEEKNETERYLKSLTPIEDWVKLQRNMSKRLEHILLSCDYNSSWCIRYMDGENNKRKLTFKYLEKISQREFFKVRNAGRHSWDEFKQLRGY